LQQVAETISASAAIEIDAAGMLVVPGLIDIHAHHFYGTEHNRYLCNGMYAVPPDGFTFRSGVTTVLDTGGAGWKNLHIFKKNVIKSVEDPRLRFGKYCG